MTYDRIMRTTVTLPEELVKETLAISGKERLSEAITASLQDYLALKKRLALLDDLFENPVPHNAKKIKADRRKRKWSS